MTLDSLARGRIAHAAARGLDLDLNDVRADFPALQQEVNGRPLVYLDSAASALKPKAVIDAVVHTYARDCANIHRGVHTLSQRATSAYEAAREKVRTFLGARSTKEIVFVRQATEAINLVAQTWGRANVRAGDEIVISAMEHHANIVPWQMLCAEKGAKLRVVPMSDAGELDMDAYEALLGPKTRLVAMSHVSNALGTVNPAAEIVRLARERGITVLLDGAQAAPHVHVDVAELGCDFYVFSGHKLYGPTGIGALYGREEVLEAMPPWQGGGDMIRSVTFEKTTYAGLPTKFEAGTPHIAGAIGLGAAIEYLDELGHASILAHEDALLAYATEKLGAMDGVRLIGTAESKVGVLSFVLEGIHPHDIGTILDMEGIAIRAGHHCAQPVMERFGIPATARASLGLYNTRADVDALAAGVARAQELLG